MDRKIDMLIDQVPDNDTRLLAWKWLDSLLELLGRDGMSSDESVDENGRHTEAIFRVKVMPWRSEMGEQLDFIDRERLQDEAILDGRGSKPIKRVRAADNPTTTRKVPMGKPKSIYNKDWYNGLEKRYKQFTLKVSNQEFEWVTLSVIAETG